MNERFTIRGERAQALLDHLQRRDRQQMTSDFEGQADAVEETSDLAIEAVYGFRLGRIEQVLRDAKQIFIGIGLNLRRRHLARVSHASTDGL
jgi:hypothetical protein